jgi:hypothetical protein
MQIIALTTQMYLDPTRKPSLSNLAIYLKISKYQRGWDTLRSYLSDSLGALYGGYQGGILLRLLLRGLLQLGKVGMTSDEKASCYH